MHVPRGSCPGGSCPQSSFPRGSCPRGSCHKKTLFQIKTDGFQAASFLLQSAHKFACHISISKHVVCR